MLEVCLKQLVRRNQAIIFTALLVMTSLPAYSDSSRFDVSKCFPDLLKKVTITHETDRSSLYLLSIVDEHTFNEKGFNSGMKVVYANLPWEGHFDAWDKARRDYFKSLNINIDQYHELVSNISELDPQAGSIIHDCLMAQVDANRYGFVYVPTIVDEKTAILTFYWKPTTAGNSLKVINSTLKNAHVVGLSETGVLFPTPAHMWSPQTTITDSMAVHLVRDRLDEAISATLTTNPGVAIEPIVIKALEPHIDCPATQSKTNPDGELYVDHSEPRVRDHLYDDRRNWHVDVTTPGPTYNMDCHKLIKDQTHFEIYYDKSHSYFRGKFATCAGWTETDETAKIYLDVFYTMPHYECKVIPWPSK